MRLTASIALVVSLSLTGCDTIKGLSGNVSVGGGSPVVQARSQGSAMLTIIACSKTSEGIQSWQQVLEMLVNASSPVVTAENGGRARMLLNGCPFPEAIPPPVALSVPTTRRRGTR